MGKMTIILNATEDITRLGLLFGKTEWVQIGCISRPWDMFLLNESINSNV